jgi:hypothetical protein
MADKSIAKLESVTTPTSEDLAIVVTDAASAPANKKSTLATFFNKIPTWLGLSTTPIVYTVGEIDVTTPVSFLSVTGSTTFSLPAGSIGQIKMLVCTVAASTPVGVLTPIANANDGYNTITFNEKGQSVTLIYENSGWIILSQTTHGLLLSPNRVIQGLSDAKDIVVNQYDGTEVARIHDGAVEPTQAGTSTSFSAGTGFGYRRRVLTLGSGDDDNTLTLTAADSGSIIFVTPTNNIAIILPLVGTETGIWFDIIVADKINKDFDIKTSGQDGADNISMRSDATDAVLVDVGAADHDILTIDNMLEGSRIELINVQGGDAELWHAYIRSNDTVDGSIV